MRNFLTAIIATFGFLALINVANSADHKFVPALVFDMGGKFDKSFNQAAYEGAEKFKKDTGVNYKEFEVTAPTQREHQYLQPKLRLR